VAVHTPLDSRVHHAVLRRIVDSGHAPVVRELAEQLAIAPGDAIASLRRLHDNHGLVLHPGTHDIWIAHPFSLSPTAVWVETATAGWWAPCLWCAFGVQTLVAAPVTITVRLGGEAETVAIRADDAGVDIGVIAHFPMPPRHAWDNVVHFCASLLPFRSERELDAWCARHRQPRGAALSLPALQSLARRWYGNHLASDWVKWTPAEAAAIFEASGLVGDFWALDTGATRF
jgi:hypothetical protein